MPFVHLERELWDLRDTAGQEIGPDAPERRAWLLDRGAIGRLRPPVERLLADPKTLAAAARVQRTTAAVKARLESEIRYWDHRANQLRERELAGQLPSSGMNSAKARQRTEELQGRLRQRLEDLNAEQQLSSLPPVVTGGALVVPSGLLSSWRGTAAGDVAERARRRSAVERAAVERAAVDAVMAIERALGHDPVEMPPNHKGYDIESRTPGGSLLFLEVKGRARGAETFTVTRSEIGVGRNMPDQHILALAEVSTTGYPHWRSYFDRGEVPA
jgi:hypothetical protein